MADQTLDLLLTQTPKPARFNRRILFIVVGAVSILVLIGLANGLQAPEEQKAQEEAEEKKVVATNIPNQIANLPDTYAAAKMAEDERKAQKELLARQQLQREQAAQQEAAQKEGRPGGQIQVLEPYGSQRPSGGYRTANDERAAAENERLMQRVQDADIFFTSDTAKSSAPNGQQSVLGLGSQQSAYAPTVGGDQTQAQLDALMQGIAGVMPETNEPDPVLKQNQQQLKQEFIESGKDSDFVNASFTRHPSPYMLLAGGTIPAVTRQGVNTDLPGEATAHVTQNVYDSVSGRYLLIPQGATLHGKYQSVVSYGQERVLIAWGRLCRKDGCLNLGNQIAVDTEGYSGLSDQVDNHYGKIFIGVLASSVLSAGAATSQGAIQNNNPTFGQNAVAGVGQEISQAGEKILEKNMNIQPTLTIRPGQRFNIQIDKDFIIPPLQAGG